MPANDETVTAHTRLWLEKAVIGLNLCPFAKAPYVKGRVRISISRAKHTDGFLEDLDRELQLIGSAPPEEIETSLLVHPGLFGDFLVFNDMLGLADQAVADNGLAGIIQIAPFHPGFQFEGTEKDDITNYTNRSPYPTLHLIRESSISKAAEAFPDAEAIFGRNMALLEKWGSRVGMLCRFPAARTITNQLNNNYYTPYPGLIRVWRVAEAQDTRAKPVMTERLLNILFCCINRKA